MQISTTAWRVGTSVVAGLGLVATVCTLNLPWRNPDFSLGAPTRLLIAVAGATILVMAGRWRPTPGRSGSTIRVGLIALGLTVGVYPTSMSLAATGQAGPIVETLGWGGHVVPLVLVQLLPVLASEHVTGRSRRGWVYLLVVAGALSSIPASTIGSQGGAVLASTMTVLSLCTYLIAPLVTWPNVRGRSGMVRRRAIVCGLAAVVPLVVIVLCMMLGTAAETLDIGLNLAVAALMLGFSAGTTATAALVYCATGTGESWLLRTRIILGLLATVLAMVTLILSVGVGLATIDGTGPAIPMLVGITLTSLVGLGSVRLHGWASRQIDPTAEVAAELAALGDIAAGEQRRNLQQALRRVAADPALVLLVKVSDGSWVDPAGESADPPLEGIRLAGSADEPQAIAVGSTPEAGPRLARLGDCSRLLQPAVLEASVQREAVRADVAAQAERRRLSQDLHDGLQGRPLGITLNLQLSGREVADPAARLLIEQTVDSLRDAVEEVRSVGDGRLPAVLVQGGLAPALHELVRPVAAVTHIQVTDTRFPAELEAVGYFVVSEAVGNAIKHAHAEQIWVVVEPMDSNRLQVTVTDDGVGGADPRLGSGLRGLAERVAASGGLLVVREGLPGGTVVEASLPCGS